MLPGIDRRLLYNVDWVLLASSLLLALVGVAMVYSSTHAGRLDDYFLRQLAFIALGLVGLVSAKESVDPSRTRLLSWLGIGGGLLVFLLLALVVVGYVALIVISIAVGATAGSSRY